MPSSMRRSRQNGRIHAYNVCDVFEIAKVAILRPYPMFAMRGKPRHTSFGQV